LRPSQAKVRSMTQRWAVRRSRYITVKSIAQTGDDFTVSLTDMTGRPTTGRCRRTSWTTPSYTTPRDTIKFSVASGFPLLLQRQYKKRA
jgi:hypothetical protein